MSKKEIIFVEKIIDAIVLWFDNENIELIYSPDIISGDGEKLRFFPNVHTNEKQKATP